MKKIIIAIVAIVAVVVLLCGGGAAYYFLFYLHDNSGKAVAHKEKPKPILFAELSNLVASVPKSSSDLSDQVYVQMSIQFATTDPKAVAAFSAMLPIIQAKMLTLLMQQKADQIMNPQNHDSLSKSLLSVVNEVLDKNSGFTPSNPFSAAYITNIVEQD